MNNYGKSVNQKAPQQVTVIGSGSWATALVKVFSESSKIIRICRGRCRNGLRCTNQSLRSKVYERSTLTGITMGDADKKMRLKRLYEQVEHYDVNSWAEGFLQNLTDSQVTAGKITKAPVTV